MTRGHDPNKSATSLINVILDYNADISFSVLGLVYTYLDIFMNGYFFYLFGPFVLVTSN